MELLGSDVSLSQASYIIFHVTDIVQSLYLHFLLSSQTTYHFRASNRFEMPDSTEIERMVELCRKKIEGGQKDRITREEPGRQANSHEAQLEAEARRDEWAERFIQYCVTICLQNRKPGSKCREAKAAKIANRVVDGLWVRSTIRDRALGVYEGLAGRSQ